MMKNIILIVILMRHSGMQVGRQADWVSRNKVRRKYEKKCTFYCAEEWWWEEKRREERRRCRVAKDWMSVWVSESECSLTCCVVSFRVVSWCQFGWWCYESSYNHTTLTNTDDDDDNDPSYLALLLAVSSSERVWNVSALYCACGCISQLRSGSQLFCSKPTLYFYWKSVGNNNKSKPWRFVFFFYNFIYLTLLSVHFNTAC